MTADTCAACPFPDQIAALELVRLREAVETLAGRLISDGNRETRRRSYAQGVALRFAGYQLRALLDDNEGERS